LTKEIKHLQKYLEEDLNRLGRAWFSSLRREQLFLPIPCLGPENALAFSPIRIFFLYCGMRILSDLCSGSGQLSPARLFLMSQGLEKNLSLSWKINIHRFERMGWSLQGFNAISRAYQEAAKRSSKFRKMIAREIEYLFTVAEEGMTE